MSFLYFLEGLRTPFLDAFFSAITYLGSETVFLAVAIIVFWCVSKRDGYYLLTVGFFGTLINQCLKLICRIPRPWVRDPEFTIVEAARADATGYSFPSGHTQSVTSVLGSSARITKRRGLRVLFILLILLTGFSRMYLGVHTPADVITSLVIGTVLVLVLYPIFEKGEKNPAYIYGVMAVFAIGSLAFLLFVEWYAWPADIDPYNLESGVKNGYLLLGCSTGMLLSFFLERKYIRFETKAVWWAQILKTVIGLVLVLALKEGLKPLLSLLFHGHTAERAVRYFILVLFAACVWPLTFRWFSKGCPLKKKKG